MFAIGLSLFAAAAFFLWMFFAVAPLEALADAGGLSGANSANVVATAYGFAADWRHGMAGNSPLYMPGFFALAVATWFWCGSRGRAIPRLIAEAGAILMLGLAVAWMSADVARAGILASLERSTGLTSVSAWPDVPGRAVAQGLYTAIVWMSSIAACRRALEGRTFAPLLIIPPITILLALVRPWTVDDFAAPWIARVGEGSIAATGSLLAIPGVVIALVRATGRSQWVQIQRSRRRIAGDV